LELSHKARYQITQAQSGPETFVSVSWSFLTRPDVNSDRHSLVLRLLSQFLGAFSQTTSRQSFVVWKLDLLLAIRNDARVKEKT
jgi:hypothetical protein